MLKKAILCVDDEKMILDSLKTQFKEAFGNQYLYEMSENVDDAMEIIDEFNEEGIELLVIVSDWLMPGIKGDEFLIEVHKKYPDIVKIMLTGQADEAAVQNARDNASLHALITKPWSSEELTSVILSGMGAESSE